jgi:hypothetical protein
MNSSHEYDLAVLKPLVEPLLRSVPPSDAHFAKAQVPKPQRRPPRPTTTAPLSPPPPPTPFRPRQELLRLLDAVNGWGERDVPSTSLLREFLGNGAYDEH